MASKVAVVTGSNKGIGYAVVKNLCTQFDGTVYLTARDVNRGKAAVESLNKLGLKPAFHQLAIDDENSIQTFAKFMKEKHGGIDVLVNNAGILIMDDGTKPSGEIAEETLRINYFSLVKVCDILFPLLRPHARVVNVSSALGHLQIIKDEKLRTKLADPNLSVEQLNSYMNNFIEAAKCGELEKHGWPNLPPYTPYNISKVGVSALTRMQHQKFLKDPREDIVINHVHPGYVDTDMTNHKGVLTTEQGADSATYAALLPHGTTSPKGDFIWHTRQIVDWVNGPTPE